MARSSRASTRRRGLLLAIVLGAALQLAHAPQAFAAIAFVKNVGFLADNITGTTTSVTVPVGGVAFGHTVLVSFAIDPVAGAVSCTDTQGNSYSVVIDFSNGSGTTGVRSVVFSARIVTALVPGNTITVTHPSVDVRAVSMNEFSGIGFVDRTHTAAGINVTPSSGSTAVTSQANELLLGSIGVETKKDDPFAAGAGYTGLPNIGTGTSGPSDSNVSIDPEYRIVAAISSYFADGSINPAQNWAATIATFPAAVCGNGVVEATEACDDGNLVNGDCCSSACAIEAAGTVCRASAGVCDVQETCTGSSPTCPADAKSTAVCRASAGICDVAESCDGVGDSCPADGFVAAGTTCRAAAGVCDIAETCTGSSAACPNDAKSAAVCRASAGLCDVAESCDGVSNSCPPDAFAPGGTLCRAAVGVCDVAENCTGSSVTCPNDAKSTAVCRASAGICDVAESCDGVGNNCPADGFVAAGTTCRAAAGVCDVDEKCTGSSASCPNDVKSTAVCRAAAGVCDVDDSCDGVADDCPADAVATASTPCRLAAGICDLEEDCDGTSVDCPADAKSTAVCRAAAGVCDLDEICDGIGDDCPPDAKSTSVCRAAAGICDVDETCDGVTDDCPADKLVSAGTPCRAAAGGCDLAEDCDGSSVDCPADAKSTAVCRPAAGICDVAESCDGVSDACPADGFVAAGTVCRPVAGACDLAESCDAASAGCPSDVKSTAVCRPVAGECDVAENCDGVGDDCPPDALVAAGIVCRGASTSCDLPEVCTGSDASCPADTGKPDTDGDGVCDALDDCPTTADSTQSDGDGDGIGDACDPCTNIVPVFAVKPRMRFSRLNVPGREKMRFKGTITVPVSPAIDPSTKGVRVLIDDADGSSMLDAIVPGGFDATTGVGWKRNKRNTAWRYRNPTGFESIVKIRIRGKRKTPGSLKFVVIGQNGTYPMSPTRMPGRGTMVIDSPFATTGQCGEALFSVAPAPSCAFKAHGRTLVCK